MEFLDQSYFTEDQKWITEKMNYRQIQASWKAVHLNQNDEFLSSGALKACLRRSSLALKWRKGKIYGNDYFLSKPDIEILKQYIKDKCQNNDLSDAKDLLEEALLIRKRRQIKAIQFLCSIDCPYLADELEDEDISQPVRSWINANLSEHDAKIRSARIVENDRYFSCCPYLINPFFDLLERCIDGVVPPLIFGADELCLDATIRKKFVVLSSISHFNVTESEANIPHITIMFIHNIIGTIIPHYVILPSLEKYPIEIVNNIKYGQIFCCSTDSG